MNSTANKVNNTNHVSDNQDIKNLIMNMEDLSKLNNNDMDHGIDELFQSIMKDSAKLEDITSIIGQLKNSDIQQLIQPALQDITKLEDLLATIQKKSDDNNLDDLKTDLEQVSDATDKFCDDIAALLGQVGATVPQVADNIKNANSVLIDNIGNGSLDSLTDAVSKKRAACKELLSQLKTLHNNLGGGVMGSNNPETDNHVESDKNNGTYKVKIDPTLFDNLDGVTNFFTAIFLLAMDMAKVPEMLSRIIASQMQRNKKATEFVTGSADWIEKLRNMCPVTDDQLKALGYPDTLPHPPKVSDLIAFVKGDSFKPDDADPKAKAIKEKMLSDVNSLISNEQFAVYLDKADQKDPTKVQTAIEEFNKAINEQIGSIGASLAKVTIPDDAQDQSFNSKMETASKNATQAAQAGQNLTNEMSAQATKFMNDYSTDISMAKTTIDKQFTLYQKIFQG